MTLNENILKLLHDMNSKIDNLQSMFSDTRVVIAEHAKDISRIRERTHSLEGAIDIVSKNISLLTNDSINFKRDILYLIQKKDDILCDIEELKKRGTFNWIIILNKYIPWIFVVGTAALLAAESPIHKLFSS